MIVYFFNLVFIGVVYFFVYHSSSPPKKRFLQITLTYLFFISSFRDRTIGKDYLKYVSAFHTIRQFGTYYFETGYVLLNRFVALFTDSYVGVAIAVNTIIFIPLYYYLKKQVDRKYWGICVFVFAANPYMFIQSTFNALRQGCATGIILIGMNILLSNKKGIIRVILYLALIVLAAQFHRIAYVFAVVPIFFRIPWKKIHWFIFLIFSLLSNLFMVKRFAGFIAPRVNINLSYVNYEGSFLNNPVYILFLSGVVLYLISRYTSICALEKRAKQLIDFYIFSLCFLIMAVSNDMIYRVYIMIAVCALPCIPAVCERIRIGKDRIRIRIRNEARFLRILYMFYYFFFYTGYLVLLAIRANTAYIPFRFCFS